MSNLYERESFMERRFNPAEAIIRFGPRQVGMFALNYIQRITHYDMTQFPVVVSKESIIGFPTSVIEMADRFGAYRLLAVDLTNSRAEVVSAYAPNRMIPISYPCFADLPLGPTKGDRFGLLDKVSFLFYFSDGKKPPNIDRPVDRFPTEDSIVNNKFSGGIVIKDERIQAVDRDGLIQASENNLPYPAIQLFYSWTNSNANELMGKMWHHHGMQQLIGDSIHNWSWYLGSGDNDKVIFITSISVFGNTHFPIRYINSVNRLLMGGETWKASLANVGPGSCTRFINQGTCLSPSKRPEITHSAPFQLIARG